MVGMPYGVLGVLDAALLWLRVAETAVGSLGAVLAVLLVLPVTIHAITGAITDAWIQKALRCVHACTAEAAGRLVGSAVADPGPRVAELEVLLGRVRLSLAPLVHPLSPLPARKARARQVLALLDDRVTEVRGLASIAADPDASHDARLSAACSRVEAAVEAPTAPDGSGGFHLPELPAAADPALAHLHGACARRARGAAPGPGRPDTGRGARTGLTSPGAAGPRPPVPSGRIGLDRKGLPATVGREDHGDSEEG